MRKAKQGPAEAQEPNARALPYALKRELEEIMKNSGREIDLNQDIPALERICNEANNPPGSWRGRWDEITLHNGQLKRDKLEPSRFEYLSEKDSVSYQKAINEKDIEKMELLEKIARQSRESHRASTY